MGGMPRRANADAPCECSRAGSTARLGAPLDTAATFAAAAAAAAAFRVGDLLRVPGARRVVRADAARG
jgi:hypothetical protein